MNDSRPAKQAAGGRVGVLGKAGEWRRHWHSEFNLKARSLRRAMRLHWPYSAGRAGHAGIINRGRRRARRQRGSGLCRSVEAVDQIVETRAIEHIRPRSSIDRRYPQPSLRQARQAAAERARALGPRSYWSTMRPSPFRDSSGQYGLSPPLIRRPQRDCGTGT